MKKETIKAPTGMVLRAYMFDINPFERCIRRVLIDEFGMVFIPGWGWSSLQGSGNRIVCLPKPVDYHHPIVADHDWWEPRAWADKAWSWCYFHPTARDFTACRVDEDGFVFAA